MEPDPGNRFEHLLKPIRDLSTVWNIDVAESLEKYCEEVSRLRVRSPLERKNEVNFAEAALLIQGSTAIYSQKVEMLYKLVYEALDHIASDKAKEEQKKRKHNHQPGGLWAPIPETDALLTVDHLLKDGRNNTFDENLQQGQRKFVQRRLPLFLMPREKADRRRQEFRISSCTVHSSGAYLFEECDSKLLDELLHKEEGISQYDDEPLAPPPPSEVADLDQRLQELHEEHLGQTHLVTPLMDLESITETNAIVKQDGPQQQEQKEASGLSQGVNMLQPAVDHWWYYDEHQPGGQELKLEVGSSTKRLDRKKLKSMMQKRNEAGTWETLPDATDESILNGDSAASLTPGLDGNLVEPLFLEMAGRSKGGSRFATHKLGLSNVWLEFEDLLSAALAKEKQSKASKRPRGDCNDSSDPSVAPATPHGGGPEFLNSDEEAEPALVTPEQGPPDLDDYGNRDQEYRQEVERIESLIQERQEQYNDTIRNKLLEMEGGGEILETDDKRFPELWANVRRWTEQTVPVLKEHESRPEFDIDVYGTKFLNKMSGIKDGQEDDAKPIPFSRLVHNQPRWEIARRFLTCLQLTNQRNTNITFGSEEERLNKFGLQLLKTEKDTVSLDTQEEAPTPLPPPPKRLRRMANQNEG